MTDAIAEMWEDVGVKVVVEVIDSATRHREDTGSRRSRACGGRIRRLRSAGSRRHDGAAPETRTSRTTTGATPSSTAWHVAARFTADERVRADAYRRMTAIFLEHNPWIVVLQPFEDYGLRRYVEFTPNPDQQLELRRFNFRLRRA